MIEFLKKASSEIVLIALFGIGIVGGLTTPAFSQGMLQESDLEQGPASEGMMESEQTPMGDMQMTHQGMPMQTSGEMLELMGEMQQLMSTLTPEQMAEFRPYMMEHHARMVEEMQALMGQLRTITNQTEETDTP